MAGALVEWNKDLSVDVSTFDEQHKRLVALLNQLHASMREGKGQAALGEVFDELLSYTDYHFGTEERAFEQHGYPNPACAAHMAEHKELLRLAKEFRSRYEAGEILLSVEVLEFLKKWVTEHIRKCDRLYSPFFKDKAVAE